MRLFWIKNKRIFCKILCEKEVNAGICTGTLRGVAIEAKINQMASQGWKFEQFKTIIGRCCLIFPRYKSVICFSKENISAEKLK
ncbi:MAG: hypothetical protein ACI4MA_09440 [Treponema sp.]